MAKTKKKKDKKTSAAATRTGGKAAKSLKALSQNPFVADVVAAALVATASALKDSKKARQLAAYAGDELEALSKDGARRGSALWDMAIKIGQQSLEALAGKEAPKRAKSKSRSTRTPKK